MCAFDYNNQRYPSHGRLREWRSRRHAPHNLHPGHPTIHGSRRRPPQRCPRQCRSHRHLLQFSPLSSVCHTDT